MVFDRYAHLSPLVGPGAALLFVSMWVSAVLFDGGWALWENTLSDLGVSENGVSRALFNSACVISGVCLSVFSVFMINVDGGWKGRTWMFSAVGGLFLLLVGVFTKDEIDIHTAVAVTFGALCAFGMILHLIFDLYERDPVKSALLLVLTAVVIVSLIPGKIAVSEPVMVVCLLVWVTYTGLDVYVNRNKSRL
ncbi:MAG: DUF998 domain-containing protein [Candidatus Methanomethylophilaceae archaeon]|nr:DUF998 domain-containing protein [Candidatus Methanomethylophilaceae archaeon]